MRSSTVAIEFDQQWAITWKRCKIGCKLVLITNRKSHMSFRLVPKLVTVNELERRNGRYFALHCISPNSVAFWADYVKWLKIHVYFVRRKYSQKSLVLAIYRLWRYSQRLARTNALFRCTCVIYIHLAVQWDMYSTLSFSPDSTDSAAVLLLHAVIFLHP